MSNHHKKILIRFSGGWTLLLNQKNGNWFTASNVLSLNQSSPSISNSLYSILGLLNSIPNSNTYMYKNYYSTNSYYYTITKQSVSAINNNGSVIAGYSLIKTTEPNILANNGYGLLQPTQAFASYGSNVTNWWWSLGQYQQYTVDCPLVTNPSSCSSYQYNFWVK